MHEGHRERMRERFLQNGIEGFAPHEVLEMLLYFSKPRVNTNETAHDLIRQFGSFDRVLDADFESLCKVDGIGVNSAFMLRLIKDTINYYTKSKWADKPNLANTFAAGAYVLDMIGDQTSEGFYVLCLDAARNVLNLKKLSEGTAYRTYIDIQLIVKAAITHDAHSIILVHNHPNGLVEPSEADIQLTRRIQNAFKELNVKVIDHIIVGEGRFFSMAEKQLM